MIGAKQEKEKGLNRCLTKLSLLKEREREKRTGEMRQTKDLACGGETENNELGLGFVYKKDRLCGDGGRTGESGVVDTHKSGKCVVLRFVNPIHPL
jgi:hypothetical protein